MRHRKAASKVQTPVTDARVNHVLDAHGRGRGPNTRNKATPADGATIKYSPPQRQDHRHCGVCCSTTNEPTATTITLLYGPVKQGNNRSAHEPQMIPSPNELLEAR